MTAANGKPKNFTFTHGGKTYEFEQPLTKVQRPGWLRANRRRDQIDLMFTILEEVAGAKALEAIDAMDEDEFKALMEQLQKDIAGALGN